MTAIIRQIEEMEEKEKAVEAGPCSTQLECRVGRGNEKVCEQTSVSRRVRCWGRGNRAGAARRGRWGGGETLEKKRKKEARHKQGSRIRGQGKEEADKKTRKRPLSQALGRMWGPNAAA
jgi:hypothetical protein